jgi:hypothetical protein
VRKTVQTVCVVIFILLPLFNVVRFDLPRQRFYFFGAELWISEFSIIFFSLMFLMVTDCRHGHDLWTHLLRLSLSADDLQRGRNIAGDGHRSHGQPQAIESDGPVAPRRRGIALFSDGAVAGLGVCDLRLRILFR